MEKNFNRHHLNWEKRQWKKNSILNRLRDHQGMIIPMNLYDHRELHQDMLPPPQPTPKQAEELLSFMGRYDSQSERIDYLDMAVTFMAPQNPRYALHLQTQRDYVLWTPVNALERDIVAMEADMRASNQSWAPREVA